MWLLFKIVLSFRRFVLRRVRGPRPESRVGVRLQLRRGGRVRSVRHRMESDTGIRNR